MDTQFILQSICGISAKVKASATGVPIVSLWVKSKAAARRAMATFIMGSKKLSNFIFCTAKVSGGEDVTRGFTGECEELKGLNS